MSKRLSEFKATLKCIPESVKVECITVMQQYPDCLQTRHDDGNAVIAEWLNSVIGDGSEWFDDERGDWFMCNFDACEFDPTEYVYTKVKTALENPPKQLRKKIKDKLKQVIEKTDRFPNWLCNIDVAFDKSDINEIWRTVECRVLNIAVDNIVQDYLDSVVPEWQMDTDAVEYCESWVVSANFPKSIKSSLNIKEA